MEFLETVIAGITSGILVLVFSRLFKKGRLFPKRERWMAFRDDTNIFG